MKTPILSVADSFGTIWFHFTKLLGSLHIWIGCTYLTICDLLGSAAPRSCLISLASIGVATLRLVTCTTKHCCAHDQYQIHAKEINIDLMPILSNSSLGCISLTIKTWLYWSARPHWLSLTCNPKSSLRACYPVHTVIGCYFCYTPVAARVGGGRPLRYWQKYDGTIARHQPENSNIQQCGNMDAMQLVQASNKPRLSVVRRFVGSLG